MMMMMRERDKEKERRRVSEIERAIYSNCNYIEARVFLSNWQANASFPIRINRRVLLLAAVYNFGN